jgi:tripartite-type tricarboxylate transporter receptor subunit TctC
MSITWGARALATLRGGEHATRIVFSILAAFALAVFAPGALAQGFPNKPVKILTPFPAGAGPEAVLRIIADKLSRTWGQQVIIENRPGGNGFIAISAATN